MREADIEVLSDKGPKGAPIIENKGLKTLQSFDSGPCRATGDRRDGREQVFQVSRRELPVLLEDKLHAEGGPTFFITLSNQLEFPGIEEAQDFSTRFLTRYGSISEVDGRDRRVERSVNGERMQGFVYGSQLQVIAELDGGGAVVSRFVYGSRRQVPDYMVKGGESYRVLSDHLGSVRMVVNVESGEVVQRMEYDTWGRVQGVRMKKTNDSDQIDRLIAKAQ